MQCVGPEQGIAGTADDLDRLSLLRIYLDQLIDIAEARRSDRNTIFEKQEPSAGPGTTKNRRTHGRLMILSATPNDPNASHPTQQLMNVLMQYLVERRLVESIDIAGMPDSPLLATLARNDNLADDVSLFADCRLTRRGENEHAQHKCPITRMRLVSKGIPHDRDPGQRLVMN